MWNIKASVWGGVTGSRTSLMTKNGTIWQIETQEEAVKKADALNVMMNGPHAKATFRYIAVPG